MITQVAVYDIWLCDDEVHERGLEVDEGLLRCDSFRLIQHLFPLLYDADEQRQLLTERHLVCEI